MKKTIISTALIALLCVSCKVTDERFSPVSRPVYSSDRLLVSLADGTPILPNSTLSGWKLKDLSGSHYTSAEGGSEAYFTLNPGQEVPTGLAFAIYPDVKVDSLHNGVFYLDVPDKQNALLRGSSSCIYAGQLSANSATLKKACAVIRFTIGCDNVGYCTLTTSGTSPMTGKAKLSMTDPPLIEPFKSDNIYSVTLSGKMEKDSTYAVAVIPGTYTISYSFRAVGGMPMGGSRIGGPYTASPEKDLNLGLIGYDLPPVIPGDRNAVADAYTGDEVIANNWAEGSSFSLLAEGVNEKYDIKAGIGTPKAIFHGNEVDAFINDTYGFLPYDADVQFDGSVISAELAAEQTVSAGSYRQFAIAGTDELTGDLQFRNAAALLKFQISDGDIGQLVFKGNNNEILAGKVNFVWNEGNITYTVVEGSDELSIKPAGASVFAPGTYYASILPQTFDAGYNIMALKADGTRIGMSFSNSSTAFARSTVVNAGKVPAYPIGPSSIKALADGFTGDETIEAKWTIGNCINVISSTQNEKYSFLPGGGGSLGTFTGNEVSGTVSGVFPYDAGAVADGGTFTCSLGSVQNLTPASANGFAVAVTNPQTSNLEFKNVAGLLKFEIRGDNIGEVVIQGNNDEDLAGKVNVSWNGGEPSYSVVEGAKTITLKAVDNGAFTPGTYYAAVLPQTFAKGITVTIKPYKFVTGAVIKHSYQPGNIVRNYPDAIEIGRASVKYIASIDRNAVWSYTASKVILASLQGTDKNHGLYLDLSTGRTFYAIGAYAYCANCDIAMISNLKNGIAPSSVKAAAEYTTTSNLNKFGTSSQKDQIDDAAWTTKSDNSFCYVSSTELPEAQFNAIASVADIKAVYDAHSDKAVHSYYGATPDCVTNANRVSSNMYLVIKTTSATEGTGYGIIKFVGLAGGTWYIEMNYKFGLE